MMDEKMTKRCQEAADLSAEFVEWLIANGHEDEAQKIGTGPDDFQMMDSALFPEFGKRRGVVKVTAELPPEGWEGTGPTIKVNKD